MLVQLVFELLLLFWSSTALEFGRHSRGYIWIFLITSTPLIFPCANRILVPFDPSWLVATKGVTFRSRKLVTLSGLAASIIVATASLNFSFGLLVCELLERRWCCLGVCHTETTRHPIKVTTLLRLRLLPNRRTITGTTTIPKAHWLKADIRHAALLTTIAI